VTPALKPLVDRVVAQLRAMRATAVAPPPPRSETRRPTFVSSEGIGFTRDPPLFLQVGDAVEVSVEGVGTLRNAVEREA
jgi:2-keto-4-pentenoate hydratase/2-oxohepta-3-ene-1,7-dioic acid hydratase in catechol pathway